jgi:pimeloyl-ACP methyl ester carboxylesterase/DNA-binding CsgD family transcriptional regulator
MNSTGTHRSDPADRTLRAAAGGRAAAWTLVSSAGLVTGRGYIRLVPDVSESARNVAAAVYSRLRRWQPGAMPAAIRYCDTPGGKVAYATTGSGPVLLLESGWITHLHSQLDLFSYREFVAALAERFTVLRYDKPGCGLSDRDAPDLTFPAQVRAAIAVADAAGAGRFAIFGASQGGQLGAALAAAHPDRVSALVLYGACADGAALGPAEALDSIVGVVRAAWGLGGKMMAGIFVHEPSAADIDAMNLFQRESASSEAAAELLAEYYRTDVTGLLPGITARTAVLHRQGDTATRFELGRQLAALIPGAELVPLPGSGHLFYANEWQPVLAAALDFLAAEASPDGAEQAESGSAGTPLTGRELEVARLIAGGLTNHAIASRLGIAPRTAESHAENIRRKLGVRSRAQIAAWVTAHRPAG